MASIAADRFGGTADTPGSRIRAARKARKMTLVELAERVHVTASAISQIETGKVQPTMKRLYDIVEALDVPLDAVFGDGGTLDLLPAKTVHQRAGEHPTITLEDGVTWERINPADQTHIEVLLVKYPPLARTSPSVEFIRHHGRETGYLHSGSLLLELGFERHQLEVGDSITFDSSVPHKISNPTTRPSEATWVTYG
nr:XRE family transcriptional regulator [uncultured Rhodococcus sp.]